jgi:two-component system sensor histidine kinase DesK
VNRFFAWLRRGQRFRPEDPRDGGWPRLDNRPMTGARRVGLLIWLMFLVFPIANAIGNHGAGVGHAFAIAASVGFVAVYAAIVVSWRRPHRAWLPFAMFGVVIVLATVLTLVDRPGWGFLFTYCSACVALVSPGAFAVSGLVLCTVLAGVASSLGGANGGAAAGFVASTAGIGLLMVLMRDLRLRNDELIEARAELAQLAVAQERERFARDLHDLLGHTLSVIALKAELAGRLLPGRPEAAASEIAEVEGVARGALSEVRDAVSGYRRPTLEGELEGARMALAAAGITAELDRPAVAIDPAAETVLAWAVREGATNVIRHSRARHCALRVRATLTGTVLEVLDDGVGRAGNGSGDGHGLEGLAERVSSVHGTVEASVRPEGGFRLAVSVPLAAS